MRAIIEIVLETFRAVPPLPHSVKPILIRIYELAKEFIERCSCGRIDDIAFRSFDMTEVWSALPSEARPSLTTSMDHEVYLQIHHI